MEVSGLGLLLQIALLVLSLLAVAFFNGAEAGLVSVSKFRIRHMAEQGNRAAQAVNHVVNQPDKFFATISVSVNAFIILATSVGTTMLIGMMGSGAASVSIASGLMTVVVVVFAEITPKALAVQASERWSLIVGRPMKVIMALESVLIYVLSLVPRGLGRMLSWKGNVLASTPTITEGELRMLIDIGRVEGAVEASEAEMLEKVFHFGDRTVREVMTPRTELVGVEQGTSLQEFLSTYAQHSHSQFPVYSGDIDNIIGILSVKDVVLALGEGELKPSDDITELVKPIHFVPETKPVARLFFELRSWGRQLVIVVDEHGGVAGGVTLRQLLETIVGAVGEEGEPMEEEYLVVDEHTYRMDGGISIHEANEKMDLGLPEGRYETVAGFVLERLGRIPKEGETFRYGDLQIRVSRMSGIRIETIEVWVTGWQGQGR